MRLVLVQYAEIGEFSKAKRMAVSTSIALIAVREWQKGAIRNDNSKYTTNDFNMSVVFRTRSIGRGNNLQHNHEVKDQGSMDKGLILGAVIFVWLPIIGMALLISWVMDGDKDGMDKGKY